MKTTELAGKAGGAGDGSRPLRAQLFERIVERIHRYFARVVWNAADVDDCVQQTLLRLERSLTEGGYDPNRSFNRWMWLKAHDVYVVYCRQHARQAPRVGLEQARELAAETPVGVEERLDASSILLRLRESLDAESCEVFMLAWGEGFSLSEIARLLGRDRKTVRKRLRAAERTALRMLQEGGYGR